MTGKKRARGLFSVAALLLCLMLMLFFTGKLKDAAAVFSPKEQPFTVVIDPGHGGVDGGAVGVTGVIEKEINLAIAKNLKELLTAFGYHAVLTRETDISLHDESVKGIASQKKSDLHNRLALMEQYPEALVVSIHQNNFRQSQYSGAQMFYGKQELTSKSLATALQQEIVSFLQPNNTREIKPAGKELFLLYYCRQPIVLAECGFLSNPEEEAKLNTEEYRRQMAFAIASAIVKYQGGQQNSAA